MLVNGVLASFQALHPGVEVELAVDAALADLATERFNAGVRFRDQVPPDTVAVPIAPPSAFEMAAAPGYLAGHPATVALAERPGHRYIRQRPTIGAIFRWDFVRGDHPVRVEPRSPLTSNSLAVIVAAAVQGETRFGSSTTGSFPHRRVPASFSRPHGSGPSASGYS